MGMQPGQPGQKGNQPGQKGMQPGHDEVEGKENLGVMRIRVLPRMSGNLFVIEVKACPRNVMFDELVLVFDPLNAKECGAEDHGQDEHEKHEAAARGCDLATASTLPGSGSQRNYERTGFQVGYTKVTMVG